MRRPKIDVHAKITDTIIAMIDDGTGKFQMPWHRTSAPLHMPQNIASGRDYRGINILSLWATSQVNNFSSNVWGTYKQWQTKDCQVRKGEKASSVVFYKQFDVEPNPDDETDTGRRMVARASSVFNAVQVDGFDNTPNENEDDHGPISRIATADDFVGNTGVNIQHGGDRAFYRQSDDLVQMPPDGLFFGKDHTRTEAYYSILLHELTHWTGGKRRLDRQFGKRFGDQAYSFEELVAELGAAFLCSKLGITNEPRQDHATYIASWLKILKSDNRAIFHAAAKASQAVDFLDARQHIVQQQAA